MADGAVRERWDRTAALWAVMANWMRDAEKRREPFTPADIHPYHRKPVVKGPPEPKMKVSEFASLVFGG
jgi:hypothetical protein